MRIYAWDLANSTSTPDGQALLNDFNTKEKADPHQAKADVLGIDRRVAKTLNFASLFGASPDKAARLANVTVREMEGFFKKQEELFPSDAELKQIVVNECRRHKGRIEDAYGRVGVYPAIYSKDWSEKGRAERQAFNFRIQATEASIMKCITIEARQLLLGKAKLVLQVHDEITFECADEDADEVASILNSVVNGVDWLPGIKLSGTAKVGDNWYQVH
jgi:DNA polymerase I-like protein with 3'-5' exonuclease and polymerase domains